MSREGVGRAGHPGATLVGRHGQSLKVELFAADETATMNVLEWQLRLALSGLPDGSHRGGR